ncbi:MAG TPA: enoyl-CoA hydratase-related protein [Caulobacteraceae bacterium]|jgi:enoyl-CoA hydratase/carnithine racemase
MSEWGVRSDEGPDPVDRIPPATRVEVRFEDRDGGRVAFVTIHNQAKHNALSNELMDEFVFAVTPLAVEEDLRCVVVTGGGTRAFVSGADVDELAEIAFPAEARAFIGKVHACCHLLRELPAPVIARINGQALGAGLELAISCDLRVAADTARFGMPEVRLGVPSVVEAALLPGIVGWSRAREMMLLGETFDATAALAMGLVDAAVPAGELDAAVERRIAALFAAGQNAVRLQKALMRRWESLPLKDAILAGADVFGRAYLTDEPARAIAAWREARARLRAHR